MGTPAHGAPYMEGQETPQQHAYDPRNNGLSRRRTDEQDGQSSANGFSQQNRIDGPLRSATDSDQQLAPKPKRSGKICGKCGEGLTGQFVRALGDTYHLECFTCHVSLPFSSGNLDMIGWHDTTLAVRAVINQSRPMAVSRTLPPLSALIQILC
jgi:hypothetical protein